MTTPDPGIYISQQQVYQEVRTLADGFHRVEGKLDQALRENTNMRGDIQDHEKRIRDLEAEPKPSALGARVEKVEQQSWRTAGASAVIAAIFVVVGQVVLPMIFK